eukprot:COSAG06_NODE_1033_length_11001_cov_5.119795_4_plen_114_part_00
MSRCVSQPCYRRLFEARACRSAGCRRIEARFEPASMRPHQGHRAQHSAIKTESYVGIGSGNAERTVTVSCPARASRRSLLTSPPALRPPHCGLQPLDCPRALSRGVLLWCLPH